MVVPEDVKHVTEFERVAAESKPKLDSSVLLAEAEEIIQACEDDLFE